VTDQDTTGSDEAPAPPAPGEQRRLAHPPSDRYRAAEAKAAADAAPRPDPSASVARGVAIATAIALVGAAAVVVLGGVATVTTGLIVVAGTIGFGVAVALQLGAGGRLARGRRIMLAVALTLFSVGLGQVGIWQYALTEGGVLPLVDYLGEVFGPLVIVEFVVGGVVAWVAAR
jgi:hypothetical protein